MAKLIVQLRLTVHNELQELPHPLSLIWRLNGHGCAIDRAAYLKCPARLGDRLLDEFVRDFPRGVLVEHRVHEGDLGGTSPRLCFRGAVLEAARATLQDYMTTYV